MSPVSSGGSGLRSPEDEQLFEKSNKIKAWVKNRMKELEDQNERLRLQNLRCTTQLQMLRSYTEKSRQLKQNIQMSSSVTGVLPIMLDSENRTSDDSGLTSDEPSERRQMTVSMNETTPRGTRKPIRLRKESSCGTSSGKDSSASDASPFEEAAKPIPTPRKNHNNNILERDSLNSYADDYEFDVEDEIFDEIESPRACTKYSDYVNLADFVAIRDDANIYSDVIKPKREEAPNLPEHKPRKWETSLYETAEKCLSISECLATEGPSCASPYHVVRLSNNRTDSPSSSKMSALSSPRVLSLHGASPSTSQGHYASRDVTLGSLDGDYFVPPDAARKSENRMSGDVRTSLVASVDAIEKSGYWSQYSEGRMKSLKRRFVVLKENQLSFYRKSATKEEEPLLKLSLQEIKSVNKISQTGGNYAFQIVTSDNKLQFMTESEKNTAEWVSLLTAAVKGLTLRDLATRTTPLDATICAYLLRVRCGHSKKMFAALVANKLMFFKNAEDCVPSCFLYLPGSRITDKQKSSSDEYSGSSDDQLEEPKTVKKEEYTVAIQIASESSDLLKLVRESASDWVLVPITGYDVQSLEVSGHYLIANEDPVYLVFSSVEDKEKWLYFLRSAAGDASLFGTPFEILMQRMLAEGGQLDSKLWKDLLLTACDDTPREPLTTVEEVDKKKTLEFAKAVYLFVSVLMRSTAVQYHIDLAQNILSNAVQHDHLKNEVFAQLIKLTSGSMPYALQGWKLLALAIPLFKPKQYALLWMLKRHIQRWTLKNGDEANMALYCDCALNRSLRMGCRTKGPSRLEVTSVLTRDPTVTKFPHSISVKLPNQQYQFDGSTEIGQCLSSLCLKLGMRPALLSGYALYIDEPTTRTQQLLKGKQKVCDALSMWESQQRDALRGRIPADCVATLTLRMRHYWNHLVSTETPIERSFLVWRMAEEVAASRMPVSNQLAEQLAALYAQLYYGDSSDNLSDLQFEFLASRCYPTKMFEVVCIKSLRDAILSNWLQLAGMSESECVRVILQVIRKWPLFGVDLYACGMRTSNDRMVFLALSDTALHILDKRHFDIIRSVPYSRLSSFGAFHNDFMFLLERQKGAESHPEETGKERITFSMEKNTIEQLTLHLAEYIRCQKLVWKVSK